MDIRAFLTNAGNLPYDIKSSEYEIETEWTDDSFDHEFGTEKITYTTASTSGHLTVTIGGESHPIEFSFEYCERNKCHDHVDVDAENFKEFEDIESPVMYEIDQILDGIRDEVRDKSDTASHRDDDYDDYQD